MNAKDISIIVGACLTVITTLGGAVTFLVRWIMKQQQDRFDKKFEAAIDTKKAEIERLSAEFERKFQKLEHESSSVKKENESLNRQNTFLEDRFKNFPARALIKKSISKTDDIANYLLNELKDSENQSDVLNSKVSELGNKLSSLRQQLMALASATEQMAVSNAASQWILDDENRHIWVEDACRAAANRFPETVSSTEDLNQLCNDIDKCLVWIGYSLEAYQAITNPPISEIVPQAKNNEIHQFVFNWLKHNKVPKDLSGSQAKETVVYFEQLATILFKAV